jgi:hypothetical protein
MNKSMKEKIKRHIGKIMIIVGSGLFFYNIFNFSYQTFDKGGLLRTPGAKELEGIAYYYSSNSLILISVGVVLIVSGILIIRNKNYDREQS